MFDLILKNGKLFDGMAYRSVEALYIKNGLIQAFGSSVDFTGDRYRRVQEIDLGGRAVLPGFTDAHAHMMANGLFQQQADCSQVKLTCLPELIAHLKGYAAKTPQAS